MRDDEGRIIVEYNTSDWRYFHLDERGSAIAWSDPAGSLASALRYGEYGMPASTNPGFFQYTGQVWLPAIGVYNYKARMYAPHLGRFLQPDPIGYEDSANLYAYAGNDPVNYVDPLGLCGGPATWTGGSINILGCQDWGPPGGTIGGGRGIAGGGNERGSQDDSRDKQNPQDNNNQCPDPNSTIGKIRAFTSRAADLTGNASNIAALAGAVPSPLTPGLEASAGALRGISIVSSFALLGADLAHAAKTGNKSVFLGDLANFTVGLVPVGSWANAAGGLQKPNGGLSAQAKKLQERAVDIAQGFNVTKNFPAPCK